MYVFLLRDPKHQLFVYLVGMFCLAIRGMLLKNKAGKEGGVHVSKLT